MMKISGGNLFGLIKRFFKRVNAPYRLTVVNKETMEEALIIHLTKKSLYIFLSTILVILFILLTSLILFTPLRYYIPGGNINSVSRKQLIQLKKLSDSLEKINRVRETYILNLMEVANGNVSQLRDTVNLSEKEIVAALHNNLNKIDHAERYNYMKSLGKSTDSLIHNGVKDTIQKRTRFNKKN
ncbi:MAG: hypothetical protein IPI46_01820 [Bacteroidetes bacterium]|nr:hypothetical protein [Bacteroidota bacterium]